MIDELAHRIWSNPNFQSDLRLLVTERVNSLIFGTETKALNDVDLVKRLVQSAAIFSQTDNINYRRAAYRIATSTYVIAKKEFPVLRSVLYLILARLGNFPAILFSQEQQIRPPEYFPSSLCFETGYRIIQNSVSLDVGEKISNAIILTDFQKAAWDRLAEDFSLGASAPTSAGKSYLLQTYIRKLWKKSPKPQIVYLVPTRALINQVSLEITQALKNDGVENVEIVTIPFGKEQTVSEESIYVLTQERLQFIMMQHPDLIFDYAIIDEAQSIGDGSRGVILTTVIENLIRKNENIQMFFASPNVSNPEIFGKRFNIKKYDHYRSREITVEQNLIHLITNSVDPREVKASLYFENKLLPLRTFMSPEELVNQTLALVHLSYFFGQEGQNLIYAKGVADCEDIASKLMQIYETGDSNPTVLNKDISDFIKENVHPEYILAQTVLKGIGFHYGAIPPLLRRSIEEAFKEGTIKFLVCTSTLLQGLNLPARNLFLNRPEKGQNTPLESVDFWNLAGRAGRLGKEFEGNVFLIDYDKWQKKPLEDVKELEIKPVIETHLHSNYSELLEYIKNPDSKPDYNGVDRFENTFQKLYSDYRNGILSSVCSKNGIEEGSEKYKELIQEFEIISNKISLPDKVIQESPPICIYRQQQLYEYMLKRITSKGADYLMPAHPQSEGSYQSLLRIFKRCHIHVFRWPSTYKRHTRAATIANQWMRGDPLPQIIESHNKYYKCKIAKSIHDSLDAIENEVRFTYVRLTTCYNSILKQVLIEKGFEDKADRIVPIPVYLEIGASSKTMLSFISMGLSRITSKKLADISYSAGMNPLEAKAWLRGQNLLDSGMSPIILNEIKRII